MRDEPVELVAVRVVAVRAVEKPELREPAAPDGDPVRERRDVCVDGDWTEVPVLDRGRMGEGHGRGPGDRRVQRGDVLRRPGWHGAGGRRRDAGAARAR